MSSTLAPGKQCMSLSDAHICNDQISDNAVQLHFSPVGWPKSSPPSGVEAMERSPSPTRWACAQPAWVDWMEGSSGPMMWIPGDTFILIYFLAWSPATVEPCFPLPATIQPLTGSIQGVELPGTFGLAPRRVSLQSSGGNGAGPGDPGDSGVISRRYQSWTVVGVDHAELVTDIVASGAQDSKLLRMGRRNCWELQDKFGFMFEFSLQTGDSTKQ